MSVIKKIRSVFSIVLAFAICISATATYGVELIAEKANEYSVTFQDSKKVLAKFKVTDQKPMGEIPVLDSEGNEILAWVKGGARIENIDFKNLDSDAVYTVWQVPVESKNHAPFIDGAEGSFRPNAFLTRGEFCVSYTKLFDTKDNRCSTNFSDVDENASYHNSVLNLVSAGLINGYPDGTFQPEATLTRAEFATVLAKAYKTKNAEKTFADTKGHWAQKQIAFATEKGWLNGYPDGTFKPDTPITRAEAVVVFNRVLGRSAAKSRDTLVAKNVCPYYDVKVTDWYYADILEAVVAHAHTNDEPMAAWADFQYQQSGFSKGIVNIDGEGCVIDENGQFCHFAPYTIIELDGKKYYTNANGNVDLGIYGANDVAGGLYYFGEDHAALTNESYGNLYFGADGKYTCGDAHLDSLVDAAMKKCTNNSMNRYQKLNACYLYLRDNVTYLKRAHQPRGSTEFVHESATFAFENLRGNCYCYASSFLLMARRLGYHDAEIISGGVGRNNSNHAWVMIGGRLYDPELEYAYRYKYANRKYYNLFDIEVKNAPFQYYFPQ